MAKFVFKLAGVLRQRQHIEDEKQRALAGKQRQLVELQNALQQMQQTVQTTNDDFRKNRLVGRLDMAFIAAHRRFLGGMQRQAMAVVQKIALAQRGVDEARAELAEAAKHRKAIEKLREKQLERWRADLNRREQAELDEIGMQLAYQNLAQFSGDWGNMKKIFTVITLTLAMNFLAVAGGVGWLYNDGRIDRGKIAAIREILFPKPVEEAPATQPSAAPTSQPYVRLEELLAKASGRSASEQVTFIQNAFDEQSVLLEHRLRGLKDFQHQIDIAKAEVSRERAALEAQQKSLDAREQQAARLASDKGFQDSLALYNAMPAKQVKTVFMGLDDQTITNYLQAMQPRAASKIIKEFKSDDEMAQIKQILEKMPLAQAATKE